MYEGLLLPMLGLSSSTFVAGHRFDPDTPIEETVRFIRTHGVALQELTCTLVLLQMQALHDVVKAGYVRYIGMSSCWAYECTL